MTSFKKQLHNNAVALISLFIAVSSLAYNTWRNEKTEEQRNIRHAAFRVLENLGELQQVVDYRYYYLPFHEDAHQEGQLRLRGFGNASMIHDLMMLMPRPAPLAGEELKQLWNAEFARLEELDDAGEHSVAAQQAEQKLTWGINEARGAVLQVLASLD